MQIFFLKKLCSNFLSYINTWKNLKIQEMLKLLSKKTWIPKIGNPKMLWIPKIGHPYIPIVYNPIVYIIILTLKREL